MWKERGFFEGVWCIGVICCAVSYFKCSGFVVGMVYFTWCFGGGFNVREEYRGLDNDSKFLQTTKWRIRISKYRSFSWENRLGFELL